MKTWFKDLFSLASFEDLKKLAQDNGIDIQFPYRSVEETDKRKNVLILDYNQIEAKGSNPVSNLCRGLVLDSQTLEVIARPFHRFFNYQEQNSDLLLLDKLSDKENSVIDICDKLDGSLIKLFFHKESNQWLIGTRAGRGENAMMGGKYSYLQSFVDVVLGKADYTEERLFKIQNRGYIPAEEIQKALQELNKFANEVEQLDKDCTYLFELCTPFNENVVRYSKSIVSFLAANHNHINIEHIKKCFELDMPNVFLKGNKQEKAEMLKQFFVYEKEAGVPSFQHQFKSENISYPSRYQMNSADINELLNVVKMMKGREKEGFVVYIDGIPKVKVKSAEYVTIHHAMGNKTFTASNAISLVLTHEEEEYLALVPEREELLNPYIRTRDLGQELLHQFYCQILNHFKDDERLMNVTPKEKLESFDFEYNYEKDFNTAGMKKDLFVFATQNAPVKSMLGYVITMLKGNPYHVVAAQMLENPKKAKEYFAELFAYQNLKMQDFEQRPELPQ